MFVPSGRAAPKGHLRVSRRHIGCCNDRVRSAWSGRARAAPRPATAPQGRTFLLPAAFPGFCRTLLRMRNLSTTLSAPVVHIEPKPLLYVSRLFQACSCQPHGARGGCACSVATSPRAVRHGGASECWGHRRLSASFCSRPIQHSPVRSARGPVNRLWNKYY